MKKKVIVSLAILLATMTTSFAATNTLWDDILDANKKVLKGYNDLQTINPTLASEWDYEKNISLTPMDVLPNSNKKVWWKCGNGHGWEAKISDRNNGTNCPQCYKNRFNKSI